MMKRVLATVMSLTLGAAVLTACGSTATETPETTAVVEEATTEAATEEAIKAEIKVWAPAEDQDAGWIQKMCDDFNKAHPNWDLTFKYETCSEGDAGKMVTQDPTAAADDLAAAARQGNAFPSAGDPSGAGGLRQLPLSGPGLRRGTGDGDFPLRAFGGLLQSPVRQRMRERGVHALQPASFIKGPE